MTKSLYQRLPDTSCLTKHILFCCIMLFYMTSPAFGGSENIKIYFYSSETNINNFKPLKMEFDGYLSKFGDYEFQPFDDRNVFEQHIKGREACLLLLSSWHYRNIYTRYAFAPYLVGVRNGKNYERRILVAGSKIATLKSVKRGPVASASNEIHTKSVLRELFADKTTADSVRVLKVPKDVDALMSVGFGMSKSALITENALNNLKMMDPVLHSKLKPLAKGNDSLLLVLAVPESFAGRAERIVKIIKNMPNDPAGMNIIKMLDLDGWKRIEPSDKSKLEG